MVILLKDHKEEKEDGTPESGPLVGAKQGTTARSGDPISNILDVVNIFR